MNGPVSYGPVVLQLPDDPAMVRVARLTASSLAAMTTMTVDDIDDVKIVVSEVLTALIQHGDGPDVTVKFEASVDRLAISGYTAASTFTADSVDLALSSTVLAALAENHAIQHSDGQLLIVATYVADASAGAGSSGRRATPA